MDTREFMQGLVEGIGLLAKQQFKDTAKKVERDVSQRGYRFKKRVFQSAVEIFLMIAGLGCLFLGIILFFSSYIPLKFVLLLVGLVLINAVLLISRFR